MRLSPPHSPDSGLIYRQQEVPLRARLNGVEDSTSQALWALQVHVAEEFPIIRRERDWTSIRLDGFREVARAW